MASDMKMKQILETVKERYYESDYYDYYGHPKQEDDYSGYEGLEGESFNLNDDDTVDSEIENSIEDVNHYYETDEENVMNVLEYWRNTDAANYAKKLIDYYGSPDEYSKSCLYWRSITPFDDVYVIDESVAHRFPSPHRDFVYSSMTLNVDPYNVGMFAYVTGSIIIDGLKNKVTARCGTIYANAITLGFVEDVVNGKLTSDPEKAKEEYGRRINEGILPDWYKNDLGE